MTARRIAASSLVLCGGLLWASAGQADFFFELGPSEVLYPSRPPELHFNHRQHLSGDVNLACTDCHRGLKTKTPTRVDHETCRGCHAEWLEPAAQAEPTNCQRCHLVPPRTSTAGPSRSEERSYVQFEHSTHLRLGDDCATCHPRVATKARASRLDYPTMDRCIDCHLEQGAPALCTTCHAEARDGTLVQVFPTGKLIPRRFPLAVIHDASFLADHALPAQRERAVCAECHGQSFCLKCHDGIGRNVSYHPDPWMALHPSRAIQNQNRCQACHRLQEFCVRCHRESGVATFGQIGLPFERRTTRTREPQTRGSPAVGPHPMAARGWLDPASPNFHGFHAQRNIRSCASCHQEQFCIVCHGSGFGGRNGTNPAANPHGPNAERLRNLPAARQNARACLKCHSPADPRWRPARAR